MDDDTYRDPNNLDGRIVRGLAMGLFILAFAPIASIAFWAISTPGIKQVAEHVFARFLH